MNSEPVPDLAPKSAGGSEAALVFGWEKIDVDSAVAVVFG